MKVKYNTDEPVVRSRWERTLIRCPICNSPMGERQGNKWWFKENLKGKTLFRMMEIDQSTPLGQYKVKCPDDECNGAQIFAWTNEVISINEEVFSGVIDITDLTI